VVRAREYPARVERALAVRDLPEVLPMREPVVLGAVVVHRFSASEVSLQALAEPVIRG